MALETELGFFRKNVGEWLRYYKGQYALVKNEELIAMFSNEDEAISAGIERLGNVPFLVMLVTESEPTVQFPALAVGVISAHP